MYLIVHIDDETYLAEMGVDLDLEQFNEFSVYDLNIEPYIAKDIPSARQYCRNMLGWRDELELKIIPKLAD